MFSVHKSVVHFFSRYIAIIEPIKTHIFCSRRRLGLVLCLVWPTALLAGLPTLLFNRVAPSAPGHSVRFCMIRFPLNHDTNFLVFKYSEFVLFYLLPMCVQIILYVIITRRLFLGSDKLHRRLTVRTEEGQERERPSDAIRARQGVVKMLIASVTIYFISYSPQHAMLFYNTFSPQHFHRTWPFLVTVMIIAYINSAINPILYGIFSQNFRRTFKKLLWRWFPSQRRRERRRQSTLSHSGSRLYRLTSVRTAQSEL